MKVIIILLIAMSVTLGSLEPAGYKQLDSTTGQSDRYLPSSLSSQLLPSDRSISKQGLTPESHYLPTSYQSPSQNVVPNSLYLPTTNIRSSSSSSSLFGILNSSGISTSVVGGIPSVQYLPSQPSISRQNPFNSGNGRQYSSQNPGTITTTTTTSTSTSGSGSSSSGITSNLDHRISNSLGVTNTHIRPQTTTSSQLHMSNRNNAAGAVSSSQYLPPPPPSPSSPSLSSIPSTSLVSTSKHSDLFIQSLPVPSSNYLATAVSKQNQYHKRINQPSSISASSSSSSSSSATSSGIISNTYLTPNKLSSSLSGFSSLSHSNQYTGDATTTTTATTATSIAGQPRQSNILVGGNINQPPGNYYPSSPSGYPDETFAGYDNHQPLAKYEFEYHVNDEYGNDYSHKESKNDNEITQGVYTVLLPDGRKQIVHYTADQNGFKPTITYEESPITGYQY